MSTTIYYVWYILEEEDKPKIYLFKGKMGMIDFYNKMAGQENVKACGSGSRALII